MFRFDAHLSRRHLHSWNSTHFRQNIDPCNCAPNNTASEKKRMSVGINMLRKFSRYPLVANHKMGKHKKKKETSNLALLKAAESHKAHVSPKYKFSSKKKRSRVNIPACVLLGYVWLFSDWCLFPEGSAFFMGLGWGGITKASIYAHFNSKEKVGWGARNLEFGGILLSCFLLLFGKLPAANSCLCTVQHSPRQASRPMTLLLISNLVVLRQNWLLVWLVLAWQHD